MATTPRIMVIDDEAGFTDLLKMNLEKKGRYEVNVQNDPAQALEVARSWQPNLILLDVVMPGMDGGEVLARFQAEETLRDVPVIFITATMSDRGVKDRKGTIGGRPFVAKPIDFKKLARQIDENLRPS